MPWHSREQAGMGGERESGREKERLMYHHASSVTNYIFMKRTGAQFGS